MAFTLSKLLQQFYASLGQSETFVATGGSTTTAVNGLYAYRDEPPEDEYLVGGALFVVRDAAGAAPEGEFGEIAAYDAGTYTWTVSAALSAAIASGDVIMVCQPTFPLHDVIGMANDVLAIMGRTADVDNSLTCNGSGDYTLPIGLKGRPPRRVYIGDNEVRDFEIVPTGVGLQDKLRLTSDPCTGETIYIWYDKEHPVLTAYNSAISEYIPENLLLATLKVRALEWLNARLQGSDKYWLSALAGAKAELVRAERDNVWRPRRRNRILTWDE